MDLSVALDRAVEIMTRGTPDGGRSILFVLGPNDRPHTLIDTVRTRVYNTIVRSGRTRNDESILGAKENNTVTCVGGGSLKFASGPLVKEEVLGRYGTVFDFVGSGYEEFPSIMAWRDYKGPMPLPPPEPAEAWIGAWDMLLLEDP